MTGRAVEDPDFMLEALRRNFLSEAQHRFEGGTRRMPALVTWYVVFIQTLKQQEFM